MDIYQYAHIHTGIPLEELYKMAQPFEKTDIKNINSAFARNLQLLRSTSGEHQWSGDGSYQRSVQLNRVSQNTHPFQGNHGYWKLASASMNHPSRTKSTCPHCGKIGQTSNMKRYHFNNCKHKV